MNEKIKALYEKVSGDEELKKSFKTGIESANTDEERQEFIIGFAKDQGFDIAPEDFPKAAENELADDELENVAGGGGVEDACDVAAEVICFASLGLSAIGIC